MSYFCTVGGFMWLCSLNDNPDTPTWFKPSLCAVNRQTPRTDFMLYLRGSANANYLPNTELAVLRNANIRGK